jgi:hypothetical protein
MSNPILIGTPEVIYPRLALNGKFIRIMECDNGVHKTKLFRVDNKETGEIAYIRFYPKWRKYVFEPLDNTVYEQVCMREIADFIERQTMLWRASLNPRKNAHQ